MKQITSAAMGYRRATNRDRILEASVELFNRSGVSTITTNHIAKHLGISPGNLYFHFANKEEIVREVFRQMCNDFYSVWRIRPDLKKTANPIEVIEQSFEVFFKYRFFHREMYAMRRKDTQLAKLWRAHIKRTSAILRVVYKSWEKAGVMRPVANLADLQMVADTVFMTSSSFLHFFESADRPATKRTMASGTQHLLRFLMPYYSDAWQQKIRNLLEDSSASIGRPSFAAAQTL